jgi:hypothetical protein
MLDLFIMLVYEQTRDNARRLTSQFRRRGIMSLRTNTTSLVASVGAFTLMRPTILEQAIVSGTIPWTAVKVTNCLLYALNVYATSQPGRIDGCEPK